MEQSELFKLYEKFYFYELESRDKILNRLQIPLAIIVSYVSFYGYIAKGLELSLGKWSILIYVFILVSISIFVLTLYNFIRAFFNHTYQLIPTAIETENYRLELIEHYNDYPEKQQLVESAFDNYLYKYYSECSSFNTKINDQRSSYIHNCNKYLILNLPSLFIIFLIFVFCGLDKNAKDKEYKIEVMNPIELNDINKPIETRAILENSEIIVDFSESSEELLNGRRDKEERGAPPTSTTSTPEETSPRR